MYQVYKISESLLADAVKRSILTALKIMAMVYLAVTVYMMWRVEANMKDVLIGAAVCIPAFGLALLAGSVLLKQSYRRFRIVLDDERVEFYIGNNDKKIKWEHVRKVNKPNGTVELQDTHISSFVSRLTGEGNILLIPELERFDDLIAEIDKRCMK